MLGSSPPEETELEGSEGVFSSLLELTETVKKLYIGRSGAVPGRHGFMFPSLKKGKRNYQGIIVLRLHLKAYFKVLEKSVWPNQKHCRFWLCNGGPAIYSWKRLLSMILRGSCLEHCGNTGCQVAATFNNQIDLHFFQIFKDRS